jgi:hypothetical protein
MMRLGNTDLDDCRVASRNLDEHVENLQAIFWILVDNGLAIKLDKVSLPFWSSTSSATASVLPAPPLRDRLQVMLDFPRPHTVKVRTYPCGSRGAAARLGGGHLHVHRP